MLHNWTSRHTTFDTSFGNQKKKDWLKNQKASEYKNLKNKSKGFSFFSHARYATQATFQKSNQLLRKLLKKKQSSGKHELYSEKAKLLVLSIDSCPFLCHSPFWSSTWPWNISSELNFCTKKF